MRRHGSGSGPNFWGWVRIRFKLKPWRGSHQGQARSSVDPEDSREEQKEFANATAASEGVIFLLNKFN